MGFFRINKKMKSLHNIFKLPECSSYKSWTDLGYEYDCNAKHKQPCENCLCTYKDLGGLWNPETGKKENKILAFMRYGGRK